MNLTLEDILDETNADQFFSEKHQSLYSVARWANILSWVMLVFFVLVLALNILSSASQFNAQYADYAGSTFFPYLLVWRFFSSMY